MKRDLIDTKMNYLINVTIVELRLVKTNNKACVS